MRDEDFWKAVQEKDFTPAGDTRTGALNLALLFGTAVIALALVLTPVLSAKTDKRMMANVPDEFDMIPRAPSRRRAPNAIRSAAAFCSKCPAPSA